MTTVPPIPRPGDPPVDPFPDPEPPPPTPWPPDPNPEPGPLPHQGGLLPRQSAGEEGQP